MSESQKTKPGRKPKLNLDELLVKVVHLLVRHHPDDLSFSRVSQLTGVPRPTLYYYFGSSFENFLAEATQFGMKAITLLNQFDANTREPNWNEFQKQRLRQMFEIASRYAWAPALYFRFRDDQGPIGKSLRDLEEKYQNKMSKAWEHYHGEAPDPKAVKLSSYIKLGILFGVSSESRVWFTKEEDRALTKVTEKICNVVTDVLGEVY